MLKEKHILFFVLGGVLINVMVLATVVLIGQRQDARLMFQKFLHGVPEE